MGRIPSEGTLTMDAHIISFGCAISFWFCELARIDFGQGLSHIVSSDPGVHDW